MIRAERPSDAPVIADVVRRAYRDVSHSDHREHLMVERLRETEAFVSDLSLLAEVAGQVAGHVLLTTALIRNAHSTAKTLALAPLSVAPQFQRRGVGGQLLRAAHARGTVLGFGSIVVIGPPDYYRRFGYEPLGDYPIALPFAVPDGNAMILPLRPDGLAGVSGVLAYADGWLDH
jgi:predicted N-acetyltransferase YhbS